MCGVSPASEELSNQCDQFANTTGGGVREALALYARHFYMYVQAQKQHAVPTGLSSICLAGNVVQKQKL